MFYAPLAPCSVAASDGLAACLQWTMTTCGSPAWWIWFNRATMRHGRPNLSKSHCLSGAWTFRIHKEASGTLTRSPGSWNEKLWISIAYTSNRFDRIACKQYVNLECESLKFLKEVHGTEGLPLYSVGGSFEFTTVVAILLSLKLLMLGSRFATVTARAKETLINLGSVHPTVQARFLLISWSSLKVKCCFAQLFDVRKICERCFFLMFGFSPWWNHRGSISSCQALLRAFLWQGSRHEGEAEISFVVKKPKWSFLGCWWIWFESCSW